MLDFKTLNVPYLIAEIGINHNGDLQIAKKLLDGIHATGWHCAKFQKRNPDISVPEKQKSQMRDTPWGRMSYIEYKHRIELGKNEYDVIDKYCKDKPLDWASSVWDLDSLDFCLNYHPPFLKIPSAKLTNEDLVVASAKSGFPVILSTGMSTIEEVDIAVGLLERHAKTYAIMHCNSSYPAKHEELNLNLIPFLRDRYGCPVGYSGHEYDLEPTVIAASLGAKIIERHITLSHNMWGTDQKSSLELLGMDLLRKRIEQIDKILGVAVKHVTKSELPIRDKLRG